MCNACSMFRSCSFMNFVSYFIPIKTQSSHNSFLGSSSFVAKLLFTNVNHLFQVTPQIFNWIKVGETSETFHGTRVFESNFIQTFLNPLHQVSWRIVVHKYNLLKTFDFFLNYGFIFVFKN